MENRDGIKLGYCKVGHIRLVRYCTKHVPTVEVTFRYCQHA